MSSNKVRTYIKQNIKCLVVYNYALKGIFMTLKDFERIGQSEPYVNP